MKNCLTSSQVYWLATEQFFIFHSIDSHHFLFELFFVAHGLVAHFAAVVIHRGERVAKEMGDAVRIRHTQADESKNTQLRI